MKNLFKFSTLFLLLTLFISSCADTQTESVKADFVNESLESRSTNCQECDAISGNSCNLEWPCYDGPLSIDGPPADPDGGCILEIATESVYEALEARVKKIGGADCEITNILICIDNLSPPNGNAATANIPDVFENPSFLFQNYGKFELCMNGFPTNINQVLIAECGATYEVKVKIETDICDGFVFECVDILECPAQCCDGCQTCSKDHDLFISSRLHNREVKIIQDLQIRYCDGTPPSDFGDNKVFAFNDSGCSDKIAKELAESQYGVTGPYVTMAEYMDYLNGALNNVEGCETAWLIIEKKNANQNNYLTLTIEYEECDECPVKDIKVSELGFDIQGSCVQPYCLGQGYSYNVRTNCGECY